MGQPKQHGAAAAYSAFFLKLQPSVRRALPPVGRHSWDAQPAHTTRVVAWLKITVIWKHWGQRTSMKKLLGLCGAAQRGQRARGGAGGRGGGEGWEARAQGRRGVSSPE